MRSLLLSASLLGMAMAAPRIHGRQDTTTSSTSTPTSLVSTTTPPSTTTPLSGTTTSPVSTDTSPVSTPSQPSTTTPFSGTSTSPVSTNTSPTSPPPSSSSTTFSPSGATTLPSNTSASQAASSCGGSSVYTIPAAIKVDSTTQQQQDNDNKNLAHEVNAEVSNVQRFNKLLTVGENGTELLSGTDLTDRVVFNFNKAPDQGNGGRFKLANVNAFPILSHQGISTAVGFLNPCSMNTPHVHPRATEWLTVVQGNLTVGYILENGFVDPDEGASTLASEVRYNIGPFEGTVFPQGSLHYQFNDNCDNATFVATLNSEDPGTSQITSNFLWLDEQVVLASLSNDTIRDNDVERARALLPYGLVAGVENCMKRCGAT